MATIFNKYELDFSAAKAELEAFKREILGLRNAEKSSQAAFQTNAQKRDAIYKEEGMSLKELSRQRDILAKKSILTVDELKQLKRYNEQIDKAEANLKSLDKQKDKVGKTNQTLTGSFQKVGAAIGVAFGISEILRFTKQAANLAAEAEGVRTAFDRVGGTSSMLQDLQRATRGTVDQLELMRQTVRASNFKVPLDQLATFFEFATIRAIETGESVDYLVNSIIDGIGRKSTLVMDNLGISATELQAEIAKVGDFGEASANIIAREMGKAGDVADTNLTKIQRSQAALKDATIAFGDTVAPVYADFLDLLSKGIKGVNALFTGESRADQEEFAAQQSRVNNQIEQFRQAIINASPEQERFNELTKRNKQLVLELAKELEKGTPEYEAAQLELAKLNEELDNIEGATRYGAQLAMVGSQAAELDEKIRESLPSLEAYRDTLTEGSQAYQILTSLIKGATEALVDEETQLNESERGYQLWLQSMIERGEQWKADAEGSIKAKMSLTAYQVAIIEAIPTYREQLGLLREGALAGEENAGVGRTLADIQEDIKQAQERLTKEVAVGTAEYYQAQAALDVLNKEFERWTTNNKTLLQQLDKISGIKPNEGMEEFGAFWRDFFSEFEDRDMPFEFEEMAEMDAMLDSLSVEDKIESITRSIERLKATGSDPELIADLEANLDKLKDKAKDTSEDINTFVQGLLEEFAMSSEELMIASQEAIVARLDSLLEAGEVTQQAYQAILDGMAAQLEAFRTQQTASALGSAADLVGIIKQVYETTTKDAEKSAGFLKALTIFQILLDQASAIASAVSAAAKGSITAVDLVVKIAAAVGAVIASTANALSQAKGANQPTRPSFGHGGEIQGKPHTQGGVPIEAEKGEYIVKSSAYAKAKEAVKAINEERFDTYVTQHYIEPLLKSKQIAKEDQDRGFARNIAESLHLDGKAEHYLKQIARKGNNARIENFDELARLMRKDNRGSTY